MGKSIDQNSVRESIISGRAALLWHSTMVGASTMGVVGDNKRGWRLGKVWMGFHAQIGSLDLQQNSQPANMLTQYGEMVVHGKAKATFSAGELQTWAQVLKGNVLVKGAF